MSDSKYYAVHFGDTRPVYCSEHDTEQGARDNSPYPVIEASSYNEMLGKAYAMLSEQYLDEARLSDE